MNSGLYIGVLLLMNLPLILFAQDDSLTVVAVQALFHEEPAIDSIWTEAMDKYDAQCAKSHGARPHMTFASFLMNEKELQEITTQFELLDKEFSEVNFSVELKQRKTGGSITYSLIPVDRDPELFNLHEKVYTSINNDYKSYRTMDEPGKWRPHVSMFSIPEETERGFSTMLDKIYQTDTLTIKGFTLLTFPIEYLGEIKVK